MVVRKPDERELLAYHWHPGGRSPITTLHLHISSRMPTVQIAPDDNIAMGDMHLPTGLVSLSEVVRLLITESHVIPRRNDWGLILAPPAVV